MVSEFAAHGECTVSIEDRLLLTRVSGPWNRELVELWAADALQGARQLSVQGRWAMLVIVSQSMLSTADAVVALGKSIRQLLAQSHPIASVYVAVPGTEGRGMVNAGLERMHHGMTPVRFFDSETEARAWLAEQLAEP